jgi:hypothetical protein
MREEIDLDVAIDEMAIREKSRIPMMPVEASISRHVATPQAREKRSDAASVHLK